MRNYISVLFIYVLLTTPLFAVNLTLKDLEWDYFKFNDGKYLLRLPLKPKNANGEYYKVIRDKWLSLGAGRIPISDIDIGEWRKSLELERAHEIEENKGKVIYERYREIKNEKKENGEIKQALHRQATCYFERPLNIFLYTRSSLVNPIAYEQRVQEDDAIFEAILTALHQMKGADTSNLEIIRIPEKVIKPPKGDRPDPYKFARKIEFPKDFDFYAKPKQKTETDIQKKSAES